MPNLAQALHDNASPLAFSRSACAKFGTNPVWYNSWLAQFWHKFLAQVLAQVWHKFGTSLAQFLAQDLAQVGWHSFGTNCWHKFWHKFGTSLAQVWHRFWHKILLTLLAILLTLLANFTNTFGFSKVSEFVRTSSQFQILLTLLANFTNTFGYFTNTFGYFTNNFGSRLEPKI